MATVEDVATLALAAVDVSADRPIGIELAARWVNARYAELVGRTRMRQSRQLGTITLPAAITDGTVDVTEGSTTIVADATAQASITAAGGNAAIADRHIRVTGSAVWYQIASYAAPNITLDNPFTQTTATGLGFTLLPRYHVLDVTARWIGKFVFPRRRRPLTMLSAHMLDYSAPERQLTADGPWWVAEATDQPSDTLNLGTAGAKRVELYPYSMTLETIYYTFWRRPPTFALTDELPLEIDTYALREGVLIDVYRYRMSQEYNAGRAEVGGHWRNESRAQETSWEKFVMMAARADRGQDDVSFILHTCGLGSDLQRDVATAYDQVYARGIRP